MSYDAPQFTLVRSDTQGQVDESRTNAFDDFDKLQIPTEKKEKRTSRFLSRLKLKHDDSTKGEGQPVLSDDHEPPRTPTVDTYGRRPNSPPHLSTSFNNLHIEPIPSPSSSAYGSQLSPYPLSPGGAAGSLSPSDSTHGGRQHRFSHIFRSRSNSRAERATSVFVPQNLQGDENERAEALALAAQAPLSPLVPHSPSVASFDWNSKETDNVLQEAIDLHESGKLEEATAKFKQLADPASVNHPLAQVLYGLALRHGWGCAKNEAKGFEFLRIAASNSALIDQITSEKSAPTSSRRGLAQGELVLAIFELGNCFRYGWGCEKDEYAARTYYETAAQLGDADAMAEAAWCYLSGFGTKKDKYQSAQYYRKAENAGRTEVGNSWIWKEKYNDK